MKNLKEITRGALLVLLLPAVASSAIRISGRVFVDRNCNGSFDADETGLECVPIRDGTCFVETDGDGRNTIDATLDPLVNGKQGPILTVRFPTGYWPVCGHFRRVAEQPDFDNVNFPLRPDVQCLPVTFIHASDSHVPRRGEVKFENFCQDVGALRWFFDDAAVHFVGIDFMHHDPRRIGLRRCESGCKRGGSRWKSGVPASAVRWLKQNFIRVRPGSRVFLFVHHPIGSRKFQNALRRYCVTHIFAGPHHQDKHKQDAELPVTISGSVSQIDLQRGTRVSYRPVTVKQQSLVMPYVSTGTAASAQVAVTQAQRP